MNKGFFLILASCGLLLCRSITAAQDPAKPPPPKRARVLIVENPAATETFQPNAKKVRALVDRGIQRFTDKTNLTSAWRSLVSTQDIVGLKVFSAAGPNSGTRPAVVAGVIEGLLAAGLPPKKIVIWDRQISDLRAAGFEELAERYKVRIAATTAAGYDEKAFYDREIIGNLVAGDLEFGRTNKNVGRKSFVSELLTRDITKIISIAPLLNHNLTGVSGHLSSLALGSVDNTQRFLSSAKRLAIAVPDIYNLPELGDRVVLNITDALIGQYEGEKTSLLHYSTTLNQLWFGKDPVALDVLAIHELEREREAAKIAPDPVNFELYENASLVDIGISDLKRIEIELLH